MSQSACYEQPLNEKVRSLLRLEFLFSQVNHALAGVSTWDSRAAIQGLLDILTLTGRNGFKRELLKELERLATTLNHLRQAPAVQIVILDNVLAEIASAIDHIHRLNSTELDAVRSNDFLSAISKRNQNPGGTCRFDVPALYHWLQQQNAFERDEDLRRWLAPFEPLQEAVTLILRTIRDSADMQQETAQKGFFQRNLDPTTSNQLIRVCLPREETVFPEISGGKHRFTIRFLEQSDPNHRATQCKADIAFDLACCAI